MQYRVEPIMFPKLLRITYTYYYYSWSHYIIIDIIKVFLDIITGSRGFQWHLSPSIEIMSALALVSLLFCKLHNWHSVMIG